jgi:hypothetical protein
VEIGSFSRVKRVIPKVAIMIMAEHLNDDSIVVLSSQVEVFLRVFIKPQLLCSVTDASILMLSNDELPGLVRIFELIFEPLQLV